MSERQTAYVTERTWTLTVGAIPPSPNVRLHPLTRNRITAPLRDAIAWQAKAIGLPHPLQRARVTATIVYDRGQMHDPDNAYALLKPLIDGLVVGGLLVDDSREHIELQVLQEVGYARGVRLLVEAR